MFSHGLLAFFITLKFLFAVPLTRALDMVATQGLLLSPGPINGVFYRKEDPGKEGALEEGLGGLDGAIRGGPR